jgi:hypothetical protein
MAAEFEHENYRGRILYLDECGDPECACAFLDGKQYVAFIAPWLGATDEWLYVERTAELDPIVQAITDSISSDLETAPTILDRTAALFGVTWDLIAVDPVRVCEAQARRVSALSTDSVKVIARWSIGDLRKIKARTHGARIEREMHNGGR